VKSDLSEDIGHSNGFKPTPELREMIRGVLCSPLAEHIVKLLFSQIKKMENYTRILEQIQSGDYEGKLLGLSFNDICDQSQASRTTVHATLAVLVMKYPALNNDRGYVQTAPGKRLAIIYSLKPEAVRALLFLFPSLAEEK